MKSASNLRFNTDSTALAELIPGSMDANNNFIVKEGMTESQLPVDKSTFEEMKESVFFSTVPLFVDGFFLIKAVFGVCSGR